MRVEQILNCSFERWYENFKHLTFKSEIVPIPNEVLEYLRSDSTIILPKSCQKELDLELEKRKEAKRLEYEDDSSDWESNDDDDDTENNKPKHPDFDEFDNKLQNILKNFNNKVFIKLNWSSPKDAYWSLNKLSCQRLSDIYILLKSSDFINHDLNESFADCDNYNPDKPININYNLILREWFNINPSMEFRCFVNKNILIGISQRDCRSFYEILLDHKNEFKKRIETFYINYIHQKFFDISYVFDVCLGKKTIKLLDFNPFGKVTDSLLYSWDELNDENLLKSTNNINDNNYNNDNDSSNNSNNNSSGRSGSSSNSISDLIELRIIESNLGINANQYSMYSQPKDTLDSLNLDIDDLASIIDKNIQIQTKQDNLPENSEN